MRQATGQAVSRRLGAAKQRADRGIARSALAPGKKLGKRGEKEHGPGFPREEQSADFLTLDRASAEGDDGLGVLMVRREDACDGFGFEDAKVRLTVPGKDLRDGAVVLGSDDGIDIQKRPAKARRQDAAHRGLAGAHESGKDDAAGKSWPCRALAHFVGLVAALCEPTGGFSPVSED
jgi:hypothetical protein